MTTNSLPDWFADALAALRAGDVDTYVAMYADDAVHEFPFAPTGAPARLEGKAAITAYMRQLPGRIVFEGMDLIGAREVGDELIVQARSHGTRLGDGGGPFQLDYVWFVTHDNGRVTHFRDYMNPLQLRGA